MGGYPRGFCQNTRQTPRETCWCGNRTPPAPTQAPSPGDRARSILQAHEGAMTTDITPSRPMASSMSTSAWTATTNSTDRTAPPTRLRPWQHGWAGSAAACSTSRSRSASCGQTAAATGLMRRFADGRCNRPARPAGPPRRRRTRRESRTVRRWHVERSGREGTAPPHERRLGGTGRERQARRAGRGRKLRRIRTGATKRERAQIEIVDGPPILGKIMRDPNANERHGSIQSRHSMRWPAPEPKPRQPGPISR